MKLKDAIPVNNEATILDRIIRPDEPTLSPDAAHSILSLGFTPTDHSRLDELAAKARTGTLTPDEQVEVETYGRIGSLLGVLKSKARRSLRGKSDTNGAC